MRIARRTFRISRLSHLLASGLAGSDATSLPGQTTFFKAHHVAFLHKVGEHVNTLGTLMAELAPDLKVRQDVAEELLAEARASGCISPELEKRIERGMLGAASTVAVVCVCTCSTIGGAVERAGQRKDLITQRADWAMANAAEPCRGLGPPVLASQRLGIETAIGTYRRAGRQLKA